MGGENQSKLHFYTPVYGTPLNYIDPDDGSFSLRIFLNELDVTDIYTDDVNCYEVASIFQIFSSAIGCDTGRVWIEGKPDFSTYSINPIGYDDDAWAGETWINHYVGQIDINNYYYVYDACIRIYQYNQQVPVNILQSTYLTNLISAGSNSVHSKVIVTINNN